MTPLARRERLSPAVIVAVALPVLLAVAVATISLVLRARGYGTEPVAAPPDASPLVVVPVDAPGALTPACAGLLAALPDQLPTGTDPLPTRPLAAPAPPGVHAWVAAPRPVVLRCGLPRPAELTPTSALIVVDGVSWLQLPEDAPNPVQSSYVAVDREVNVVLTLPAEAGSGPLQAVSDTIGATLPAVAVPIR